MKKWVLRLGALLMVGLLSSCVSAPRPKPGSPSTSAPSTSSRGPTVASVPASTSSIRSTIQHIVGPGETLWRIAKMYDVPMANIMSANSIRNSQGLKMGQRLRIPHAAEIKPVVALYPSDKWRYIIIHHSATDEGSSLAFHHSHLAKGWDKGVGYHFVIDNRSGGKQDGAIEATPRWIKQLDGAHCKAADMNMKAIGICLVGNFDSEKVSGRQMSSLVYLVTTLQKYYNIPNKNIMAHGHVDGASTHCPGKEFPWTTFKNRIK